ncbi:MAG TPA: hypothetical protein VGB23_08205 [Nitrospirota bacterium]|jgi:TM2 domain-containing membrane protein YozV
MTHAYGKKSVIVAVALSGLACPGAGQIYYRRYVRGTLLIAASLAIVVAVFIKTWASMRDIITYMPPDQALTGVHGVAELVVKSSAESLSLMTYVFAAIWLYGIIDAMFVPAGKAGGGPAGHG